MNEAQILETLDIFLKELAHVLHDCPPLGLVMNSFHTLFHGLRVVNESNLRLR